MVQFDKNDISQHDGERGFALVLVLVILMTLTVLGIGVMTSSQTNSAMSRNYEKNVQAVNMSETGIKVAYREMINAGFVKTTHTIDKEDPASGDNLISTGLSNYYVDADGYYVWEWDSSKTYDPMWNTDKPHGFKFCIYYTSNFAFVIESEGWYDTIHRRTRAKGEIEPMFQFSYFAARDLGEFVRGATQEIRGKVHANGNMFIRPDGSTLKINSSSVTATGSMVRSRDAWGRPDVSSTGHCLITKNEQDSGVWVEMMPGSPRGSEGIAFDSFHADWNDKTLGAHALWGGVVRDKVAFKSPPPVQNLDPGGYYDQEADLHITNTTHTTKAWATSKNIFNYNEQLWVTVEDINIAALIASPDWPVNGLIYCSTPVRLSNADSLLTKLMVASNSTIYTHGNFNVINKKGASIMTKHRIYHMSLRFPDAHSTTSPDTVAVNTTINAALVDGAPTIDEYNYVDRDDNNAYDASGVTIYSPESPKTAAGYHSPPGTLSYKNDPWANVDDLLENWSGKTLTKYGSVVHLTGAEMCANLNNSGIQPGQLAWVRKTGYNPPTRVYSYDPDLGTPSGQPPFTPLIGHITSWAPF
ncbi:pilus assembly PilX N-terminal domain-containing protein [bacterium]|nr:pilus assembly PilX N-terminal domain-containing protein [bacterium]